MSLFTIIGIFGIGVAIFVVGMIAAFDRRRRAGLPVPSLPGQHTIAQIGMHDSPPMSLDTVIMLPTRGLRFAFLGLGAFAMWFTWGPLAHSPSHDFVLAMLLTCVVFYSVVYIANYEVRYDSTGITAPNWFFRQKTHSWAAFDSIQPDGKLVYTLRFRDTGTVPLQKYLVGMPTFLTFVSDVEAMHQRT